MANKSYDDWKAQAAGLSLCDQAWIDGRFVPALGGETFATVNPATEQVLAEVAACDSADVDVAVRSARAVFARGDWSGRSPAQRKQVLLKLADLIELHQDELALLDTLDMGKSIRESTGMDLPSSIDCWRWTAEAVDKVYGEIAPTGNDALALMSREPIGVIGAIVPWNYPLMMASWKLAPALAAGNSVVLKPSEKSPLSVLRLAQLAREAGLPDGVLNVLPGYGHTAGKALALHMDVDVLVFTGSTRVAGMLMEYAGQSNLKRVWLEAGGKSPNIVFDDCEDIAQAAANAAAAIYSNQGEVCIAASRLYVQKGIRDEFLAALREAARAYQPGDPLDPATTMGPLVDAAQLENVNRYIASGLEEGGSLLFGGVREHRAGEGFYAQPTLIGDAHNGMTFVREEIFGPVLALCGFDTEEEAVQLANDSVYGLGACVWTSNLKRAHRVSRKIQSGMVWVNGWGDGDQTVAFGGVKGSGNGRDKSLHALSKYTELKTIWFRL
ncbi:aldehyde dehydrogenase [Marinobacterium rhizophilum]|uniref:Aldehyde dehydrogenase n=1 Tax=Marinobacterium rhizophilum TaxID=420402 RepID=A0ABY5HMW0_9GAMM|nr:aldehyde dehydrogenase [Marinobacterium rhizophilum]UTW12587.1 aldehyde dehydrogenase [Marinobacterium rhizophilum]